MNATRYFTGTQATVSSTQETFVTSGSRVKREVKVEKHIVTFNEDEDEHILVEEGPQIERDTVFLRDTCHREIPPKKLSCTSGSCVKRVLTRAMSKWRKTL